MGMHRAVRIVQRYNGARVGQVPERACSVRCRWLFLNGLPLNIMDRRLGDRLLSPQVEFVVALPMKADWAMYRWAQRGSYVPRD